MFFGLLKISEYQTDDNRNIIDFALEEAIKLTQSSIGYIYYYSEESQEFTLNSWSKEAMAECRIETKSFNYRIDEAGIWAEALRQKKSIIVGSMS